ncbi:purine nucleoside phosphorylase DeoD-type [Clostridium novyi B str. ATCC 27606]|uniref:Purine nucleoside phosphorylase DeoD-type n=1 Tax=Clostridium novyi B str. ATCC 27606 TaxID=1443123 RepID=A0AA40ITY8_CLONO|nr:MULTISPECIES: purine-nucleoside phosphorylase [Clostridium]KEI13929.1 purine nucleoside phosphorylase DeoD-type [Clostridium novyi B str. NCTC 9691]KEI16256.1 purine nucleoside phosphorylase DeoD-type [Clostridium novyi B str. ATCC 27606]OOB75549.1 purine nucleoside phosphorylase DeoD-type [Clostridium haemolyticum]CAG7840514.1 Purine nucleoside phosphorylase DeoD-type [Clostridium haemolyticum]
MSVHIEAKENEIAKTVLLPGDPLRAKFIAENFLEDVVCYNKVRGMYGFTGTYKGKRVSVQGSGMGIPSMSIYANELIESYGVKNLIRVGTCGSINKDLKIRDIILAMGACTNSGTNKMRFNGMDFAPIASFHLLKKAYDTALNKGLSVKVGNILSSDLFYNDDKDEINLWSKYGVLAIEMETSGLYTLGAKYGVNTLTILTVSDSLITGEETTAKERETTFTKMMEIALDIAE